jgi:hypothetical protein
VNSEQELEDAQRIYKDILLGHSQVKIMGGKTVYVKHLSDLDHGWIKDYKKQVYDDARERGIFTEKDKLNSLSEQGLWSKENNLKLEESRENLSRLYETKAKLIIKKQIKQIQSEIDGIEAEVRKLEEEKDSLIGITCENFSIKKANERYLYYTLFKDPELEHRYFSEEEFDEVEDNALTTLIILNNSKMKDFEVSSLRRISAAPFFLNSMMISKNNPMIFYGKPIIKLTNYQLEIFSTGTRYKNLIEQKGKTPPPLSSLSECVDFYEQTYGSISSGKDGEDALGTSTSIVGATAEEMKQMAEQEGGKNVVNMVSAAAKVQKEKGGAPLTMMDMIKIHGD